MAGEGWTGYGENLASYLKSLGEGLGSIANAANDAFKTLNDVLVDNWQSDSAPDFNPKLNAFAEIIKYLNLSKEAVITSASEAATILAEDQHETFNCETDDNSPVVDVKPLKTLGDGGTMTKPAIRDARDAFVKDMTDVVTKLNEFIKQINIPLYDEGERLVTAFNEILSSVAQGMDEVLTGFVTSLNTALAIEEDDVTAAEKEAANIMEGN